jgi:hypothetical protein
MHNQLQALADQYKEKVRLGHLEAALAVNVQAQRLVGPHPQIMGDAGYCHLRLGRFEMARDLYRQAAELAPDDVNLWDGLAEACGHLGLMDEVRESGLRSLTLKDARQSARQAIAIPAGPAPRLSPDRTRNIISFSLFGDQPRYCETALLNVIVAARLMPAWVCRFHVDDSVPADVCDRLQSLGAQVVMMEPDVRSRLSGLMWRFLVMEDRFVDRYLIRDADSLISTREAQAVHDWCISGKWFHVMRDYFTHTELLLAGMWGGCGGVFTGLIDSMERFVKSGNYLGDRVVDQHYLRACVWPTVRQSMLCHDSVFGFQGACPFPEHAPHGLGDAFHVGCNLSGSSIGAASSLPDGTTVRWRIEDQQGQTVCRYKSVVTGGHWNAHLPKPHTDQIRQGLWRVVLEQ